MTTESTLTATQAAKLTPVNGHPVELESPTPGGRGTRPGRVILARTENPFQPYVTAWQGEGDSGWWQGHYFNADNRAGAVADFAERCRRMGAEIPVGVRAALGETDSMIRGATVTGPNVRAPACPTCNDEPPIEVAPGVVCSCPDCGPHPVPRSLSAAASPRCRDCGCALDHEAAPYGVCWDCEYAVPTESTVARAIDALDAAEDDRAPLATVEAAKARVTAAQEAFNLMGAARAEHIRAHRKPTAPDGGAFPMWALTAERYARAIDDSRELGLDLAAPFESGWADDDSPVTFWGDDSSLPTFGDAFPQLARLN